MKKLILFAKVIEIMEKYVPNLNHSMLIAQLNYAYEDKIEFENGIRYVTLEDDNMCSEGLDDGYIAHYHSDMDLTTIWEYDFCGCGYKLDELDEEVRDSYLGVVDLKEGKYLRFNGNGESHEYGSKNPPIADPNWELWVNH